MKRRKLEAHLRARGCVFVRQGGDHDVWVNPINFQIAPIPRHNEIKTGTAANICRTLGVDMPKGR